MDIKGKKVLVTGAGAGIGRAVAIMFADKGADTVVVVDINAANLASTAEAIGAAGAKAILGAGGTLATAQDIRAALAEADRAASATP